jgi:hypothetical protein
VTVVTGRRLEITADVTAITAMRDADHGIDVRCGIKSLVSKLPRIAEV